MIVQSRSDDDADWDDDDDDDDRPNDDVEWWMVEVMELEVAVGSAVLLVVGRRAV